jgi:hypothetical protein
MRSEGRPVTASSFLLPGAAPVPAAAPPRTTEPGVSRVPVGAPFVIDVPQTGSSWCAICSQPIAEGRLRLSNTVRRACRVESDREDGKEGDAEDLDAGCF